MKVANYMLFKTLIKRSTPTTCDMTSWQSHCSVTGWTEYKYTKMHQDFRAIGTTHNGRKKTQHKLSYHKNIILRHEPMKKQPQKILITWSIVGAQSPRVNFFEHFCLIWTLWQFSKNFYKITFVELHYFLNYL